MNRKLVLLSSSIALISIFSIIISQSYFYENLRLFDQDCVQNDLQPIPLTKVIEGETKKLFLHSNPGSTGYLCIKYSSDSYKYDYTIYTEINPDIRNSDMKNTDSQIHYTVEPKIISFKDQPQRIIKISFTIPKDVREGLYWFTLSQFCDPFPIIVSSDASKFKIPFREGFHSCPNIFLNKEIVHISGLKYDYT